MTLMQVKIQAATPEDAESVAALRNAVSDDLTFKYGRGAWTVHSTTAGVLSDLRNARLLVALHRGEAIATLKLSDKKPWATDPDCFSKVARPCYLSAMAVAPDLQHQGIGRQCLEQAVLLARRAKADAIFLGGFDHPAAGAGPFFFKGGFRETGRAAGSGTGLVYYEMLLGKNPTGARKQRRG